MKQTRFRYWYVRLAWPTGLVLLLVVSLPRVTTLAGLVYLIVIDVTGIVAGLQGATWARRGEAGPVPIASHSEGAAPRGR